MKGNLKISQIIWYGLGGEAYMIVFALTTTWMMYGYCPPAGKGTALVSLATFSTVTTLARILEALLNPVVGILSDNTRTRWGRRIPYIFVGTVVMAVSTIMISRPPVETGMDKLNVIYFSVLYIILTISSLIMFQPILALGPEITVDSNERVKVTSITLFMGVLTGLVNLTQGPIFQKFGFADMTLVFGILAFILGMGPVLFINEKRDVIKRDNIEINHRKISFIKGLKGILGNKIFMLFTLANSIQMLSFITLTTMAPYLLTEIAGKRPADAATLGLFSIIGMFFGIPAANLITKRMCKKKVFAWSVLINSVLFGLMSVLPLMPKPYVFKLILAFAVVFSFFFMFTNTVKNPMMADIILFDSQFSGERKEALYIGTHGLIFRMIDSTNIAITGALFYWFGYSADKPLGILLVFPICALLNLLSYLIIQGYPLDDKGGFLEGYKEKFGTLVETLKQSKTKSLEQSHITFYK